MAGPKGPPPGSAGTGSDGNVNDLEIVLDPAVKDTKAEAAAAGAGAKASPWARLQQRYTKKQLAVGGSAAGASLLALVVIVGGIAGGVTHKGSYRPAELKGCAAVPKPSATSATVEIGFTNPGPIIPKSFLGLSHEYTNITGIDQIPRYADMLNHLTSFGGGPLVIRIGGVSTDEQLTVPGPEVWASLSELHRQTGALYIIGVNLLAGDKELARRQFEAAKAGLPSKAVIGFELGNEPSFHGKKGTVTGEEYIRLHYNDDFKFTAAHLQCPNKPEPTCQGSPFVGPAWGHIFVRPSTLNRFLKVNNKYLKMVTVHFFKDRAEKGNSPASLLDEVQMRRAMKNLGQLVQISTNWTKPLRIGEINTISNAGQEGVSDTFAAALWTLDASMEIAAAGAVGVNFHQGNGQNFYSALLRTTHWANNTKGLSGLREVIIRPPFYGLAAVAQAIGAQSQILRAFNAAGKIPEGIKVWPLWDDPARELRVVMINKQPAADHTLTVQLPAQPGVRWGPASVTRLAASGPAPLYVKDVANITLGGASYKILGGDLMGQRRPEGVDGCKTAKDGKPTWTVKLPAASAAIVTIKRY